jgi:hypothetical protein
MDLMVSRAILKLQFEEKMLDGKKVVVRNPVDVVESAFGANIPKMGIPLDDSMVSAINGATRLGKMRSIVLSGKYESGLDYVFGKRGSINDRIRKGVFSTGNTLNDNWSDLFDAIRLDLTIRKAANPTVRQFIYSELQMPNATKDVRPSELFPYGVVFEENNGEGQSVRLGQNLGGQYDTIPMKIYAAGFVWTLLAALFDGTYDLSRLTEGVALGFSAKKDDLAMAPIFAANYGTVGTAKWTAASSVGTLRQEKLMNTLMDTIDGLGERIDPITKRKIVAEGLVCVGTSQDIRHIAHVMSGLGNSTPEKYSPLSQITRLIAYDGEVIDMPNETITYGGATNGFIHLIKPNRYFKIPIKRNLVMEIDKTPDVKTLAREERAWYFSEAMYNDIGLANFVQKATLSAW